MTKYPAQKRYDASCTTQVALKLNKKTDADILAWLSKQATKQGYIKSLIRADMAKTKGEWRMYTRLPETIRVNLPAPRESCYVLIAPDPTEGPAHRDFYIVTPNTPGEYMFGCNVQDNDQAVEIALSNAIDYI